MKNNSGGEDDALQIFNEVKDTYAEKIEELNELKREVFKTDVIDQQQKSKLRITIESLLIDLNEEIFSISEELAKSYTFERQKNLLQKAKEFDQRKKAMLKKIKDCITENSSVKIVRRSIKIHNNSPPQKDTSHFGNTQQSSHKFQQSPKNSTSKVPSGKQDLSEMFLNDRIPQSTKTHDGSSKNSHHQKSQRKQKSPTPLRRKDIQNHSFSVVENRSKSRQNSAKKQLFQNNETRDSRDSKKQKANSKTRKKSKKLEEFEKYLELKKGKENAKPYQTVQVAAEQENSLHQNSTILQSEAFQQFAQDFAHMKNKVLQIQNKFNENEAKTKALEEEVEKLKTENLKLNTDVKIIRGEHSEILHTLYQLEKKNNQLQQENQVLKRLIQGERELKGQESNLPRPYIEPGISLTDQSFQQDQKTNKSPFSSVLQKNRSYNQLRESKEQPSSSAALISNKYNPLIGIQRDGNSGFQEQRYNQTQSSFVETAKAGQISTEPIQPYHNVRSSQNRNPSSSGLLSASRERQQYTVSYQNQQPNQQVVLNTSNQNSGPVSRRDQFGRVQDTPTTPDRNMVNDETPSQFKRDEGSRPRSFLQNKKVTPNQSQIMETSGQLSDWVLERINKNKY